ncbi:MAG: hypothetical protein EBX41_07915 [Chitinophagia bacterium]|nr:hypothetical protein [Chitinophagia bacterium]
MIGLFIFVLFSLPYAIYRYYKAKYKQARGKEEQAWWAFRTATFYLHLTADRRIGLTPMQYAVNVVDKKYGTQLANFMTIFLKKKYANQPLTAGELNHTATFLAPFLQTVGKQIKPIRKIAGFLNPFALLSYYRLPTDEKEM